ncbi:MAG: GIY-YIG nuclease family protein [Gammaproteobacteria bacterium]|nr:GIY-YIG nuclease family protein [Gammaproteobacteria bacterium]
MDKIDKQTLKQHYKENPPPMGIYLITNKVNGRRLLGASRNIPGIFNRIKFGLKSGNERNSLLLADWEKYGEEQFSFEIVDELEPTADPNHDYIKELQTLLQLWQDKLPNCEYNL